MTLRLDLKPYEGFLINGALIRNGGRRANIAIETQCKFLRESEVIKDSEADTPAKKLCVTLQVLYLADDPAEVEGLFQGQALELMQATPSTAPFLLAIYEEITAGRTYQALKRGRELLQYESSLREAESGRADGPRQPAEEGSIRTPAPCADGAAPRDRHGPGHDTEE